MTHRVTLSTPFRVAAPRLVPRVPRLRAGAWSRPLAVGAVAAVLVASAAIVVLDPGSTPDAPATRPGVAAADIAALRGALLTYEGDLEPLVTDAAKVVGAGLRAGVDDVYADRYDDATLTGMTSAWLDDLTRIRRELAAVGAPGFLAEVHRGYLAAFDGYVEVAELLAGAVAAEGDERRDLVMQAAHAGEAADAVYDRAEADLAAYRSRLGLPTTTDRPADRS